MKHSQIIAESGPQGAMTAIVTSYSRAEVEALTEALIAFLDALDGDPDLEDGDGDAQCNEDEISCGPGHWGGLAAFRRNGLNWRTGNGPGCEISDAAGLDEAVG